jgi:ATP-dependent RNA helicase MSS116
VLSPPSQDKAILNKGELDILVATPGRLNDHLQNTRDFSQRLGGISFLILDEGDQLLDQGFRSAIEAVLKFLPAQRQTMCFSATVPASLKQVLSIALKRDYVTCDTVGIDKDTHDSAMVPQAVGFTELKDQMAAMYCLIAEEMRQDPNHKVIIFMPTARQTQFVAESLGAAGIQTLEIHSRKSQVHRSRTSDQFRAAKCAVMSSSDVSARGVDYPDVTLVIQVRGRDCVLEHSSVCCLEN